MRAFDPLTWTDPDRAFWRTHAAQAVITWWRTYRDQPQDATAEERLAEQARAEAHLMALKAAGISVNAAEGREGLTAAHVVLWDILDQGRQARFSPIQTRVLRGVWAARTLAGQGMDLTAPMPAALSALNLNEPLASSAPSALMRLLMEWPYLFDLVLEASSFRASALDARDAEGHTLMSRAAHEGMKAHLGVLIEGQPVTHWADLLTQAPPTERLSDWKTSRLPKRAFALVHQAIRPLWQYGARVDLDPPGMPPGWTAQATQGLSRQISPRDVMDQWHRETQEHHAHQDAEALAHHLSEDAPSPRRMRL